MRKGKGNRWLAFSTCNPRKRAAGVDPILTGRIAARKDLVSLAIHRMREREVYFPHGSTRFTRQAHHTSSNLHQWRHKPGRLELYAKCNEPIKSNTLELT
uniref:Uncharacterized protein n=1 Tax=Picea glauca TaxID=3330 RepID=A0A101LZ13_PICGL|nr:hypothetical protein ABT39_MTgene4876 [Picea glauca]QHR92358.1 hypothetical protein Q903MT_gene6401 [Picea sitchensis]